MENKAIIGKSTSLLPERVKSETATPREGVVEWEKGTGKTNVGSLTMSQFLLKYAPH